MIRMKQAAAGLAVLLSLFSVAAPTGAAQLHFSPPPGLMLTHSQPSNGLMIRSSRTRVNPVYLRQVVRYQGKEKAGTVVVDTRNHFLYLIVGKGKALRYGIGVARDGFEWRGTHKISNKREWPSWTPPAAMLKRQPHLPRHMEGGVNNPLGARALYLGSTLYRIHGTNEPWTIGMNVSSGCIRMTNEDVMDLYERVKVGTRVIVL